MLVDCYPESQNHLCKITEAWYRKKLRTLEPYEDKLSSTDLRGIKVCAILKTCLKTAHFLTFGDDNIFVDL
jgi:hypothetical protein